MTKIYGATFSEYKNFFNFNSTPSPSYENRDARGEPSRHPHSQNLCPTAQDRLHPVTPGEHQIHPCRPQVPHLMLCCIHTR